jgi:hypothetical protein
MGIQDKGVNWMADTITINGLRLSKFTWKWLQALHARTAENKPVLYDRSAFVAGLIRRELIAKEPDGTLRLTKKGDQAVVDYRQEYQRKFPAQAGRGVKE